MLRERKTSGRGFGGCRPLSSTGGGGGALGPPPLLSTVLLQFAPFLSAEDWMGVGPRALIPSRRGLCRGWSVSCYLNTF